MALLAHYRSEGLQQRAVFPRISDAGFRRFSQFEEDGILLYLLGCVGVTDRVVVEIGCGTGLEGMSANLIVNHGFGGLLVDGDRARVATARAFFKRLPRPEPFRPVVTCGWVTRENVNSLIRTSVRTTEVDVLALDLDGVDWHIWAALDVIQPRICVIEVQDIIPAELSLTVPYSPTFRYGDNSPEQQDFRGASLKAMVDLAATKGYRLVGGNRLGFNAFFVRQDLAAELLPEVSVATVLDNAWSFYGRTVRWPRVRDLPWEVVG
jgi:hypothetical protein